MAAGTYTVSQLTTDDPVLSRLRDGDKYYKCTSEGTTSFISTRAYGVWEFSFLNNNLSDDDFTIKFLSLDDLEPSSADNGYSLVHLGSCGRFSFVKYVNGVETALLTTTVGYVSDSVSAWYSIKVIRNSWGKFTVLIKGGAFGDVYVKMVASSGSNPVTDNTHTHSIYMVLMLRYGDGFMWTPAERITSVNAGLFGANPFIPPIPKTNGAVSITV